MDKNVRFRREALGFNKDDVYDFIEDLYKTFDEQLKQKDEQIEQVNKQNSQLREQIKEYEDKFAGVEDYKANIADVLLRAKGQGEEIIKEAIRQGEERKKEIDEYIRLGKQRLDAFKGELKSLREGTIEILNKYQGELEELIGGVPTEDET